jgi:hypothetical protein
MKSITGFFRTKFEGRITAALTETAAKIAEDARRNADNNNLPQVVSDAISVGSVEMAGDGKYSISITVDLQKAPMARAYEKGSGLSGEERASYPIPKVPGKVSFLWKYPSPWGLKKQPGDEFVSFAQVYHPGVEAKPYLQPAIDENIKNIKLGLLGAFMKAYRDVTPAIEYIK